MPTTSTGRCRSRARCSRRRSPATTRRRPGRWSSRRSRRPGSPAAEMPAVLVASHGPFTWGPDALAAADNAIALEAVAAMASMTLELDPEGEAHAVLPRRAALPAQARPGRLLRAAAPMMTATGSTDAARLHARGDIRVAREPVPAARSRGGPHLGHCRRDLRVRPPLVRRGQDRRCAPVPSARPRARIRGGDRGRTTGGGAGCRGPGRSVRALRVVRGRAGEPVSRHAVRRPWHDRRRVSRGDALAGTPAPPPAGHALRRRGCAARTARRRDPRAVDLGLIPLGGRVGVYGCGPIGLLLVQLALAAGASSVVATDLLPHRVAAARSLGADLGVVVDASGDGAGDETGEETGNGRAAPSSARASGPRETPVDVAFEAAGSDAALSDAIAAVRPGGRVVLVGIPGSDRTTFPAGLARRKELSLVLSRRMVSTDLDRAIVLAGGGPDPACAARDGPLSAQPHRRGVRGCRNATGTQDDREPDRRRTGDGRMTSGPRYTIGVDFGTESARAVLVDVADGREVHVAVHPYATGSSTSACRRRTATSSSAPTGRSRTRTTTSIRSGSPFRGC